MKELQQASTLSSVWVNLSINSLFPSYLVPLFQNESSCDLLYENEFGLHKNERTGGTHFQMTDFVQRRQLGNGLKVGLHEGACFRDMLLQNEAGTKSR